MGLKYRWMQKEDLNKIGNENNFTSLLKESRTIANVVESDGDILGWVVYKIEDEIKIIRIAFDDESTARFIFNTMKKKFPSKPILITVSDRDLKMHLLLKDENFIAFDVKRSEEFDLYSFTSDHHI
jgi:hypothetical protein